MFGGDIYSPKPEILFEPRALRTTSIAQVYSPSFIRELGIQRPYHETYAFWTNPENISGQVWYVGYYSDGRRSSPEFEIPEVWGGNKR